MPKKKIVEEEPLETIERLEAEGPAVAVTMPPETHSDEAHTEKDEFVPAEDVETFGFDVENTIYRNTPSPSLSEDEATEFVSVNLLDGSAPETPVGPESEAEPNVSAEDVSYGIDHMEDVGEEQEAEIPYGEKKQGSDFIRVGSSEEPSEADASVVNSPLPKNTAPIQEERTPGEERRAFYNLDFNELDRDLSPEQRQEWNSIYASYRGRNAMSGTIVGVDQHRLRVRDRKTGAMTSQQLHCAIVIPFRVRILIPETEMWMKGEERPGFVLRNMPGAKIDFVIIHVDREAGFAVGSRRLAMPSRRYYFSTQPTLNAPGSRVSCDVLVVGPRRCLVSCYGYDVDLSQRELSYTAIPDLREVYHSGQVLDCIIKTYDGEANRLSVSVKETIPNPYDGAAFRHPVQSHRQGVIAGKYGGGVFCNLPDGVTVMCSYSFHYDDSAFRSGDRVMLIIQHYDDKKKQIYGKIVAKC